MEWEYQSFTEYGKYKTRKGVVPYLKYNGKYVEDLMDESLFREAFKDCKPALELSLKSLEEGLQYKKHRKKVNWLGNGLIVGGILGAIYVQSRGEESSISPYAVLAGGIGSGFITRRVFGKKATKAENKSFFLLSSAVSTYNADCYQELPSTVNEDIAETGIKNRDLSKTSFNSIDLTFLDGRIGESNGQVGMGLGYRMFKNGYYFGGKVIKPIFDGARPFWDNSFKIDGISGPFSTPIEGGGALYSSLSGTIPFLKKIKTRKVSTELGTDKNLYFTQDGEANVLYSWGFKLGGEYDKAVLKSVFASQINIAPSMNSLNTTIIDANFLTTNINLMAGISRTMFTTYDFSTNDNRFDAKAKVLYFLDIYLLAKYNVSSSFADMQHQIFRSAPTPIEFIGLENRNLGFVLGIDAISKKGAKSITVGAEIGTHPWLKIEGLGAFYGGFKLGYSIVKISK